MLDTDGISERDQATHRAGPVDANSNTASLEIDDNGAVDADEEGARAPQVSSVDDESREDDEEEKEEKEEKDDVHEDEHVDDDPGSSEHESTFQSSTPLSLFPCCVFSSHVLPSNNSDILLDSNQSLEPDMLLKNIQWINSLGK